MTIETAKMSERGQIIIPKEVREYVHATDNTIFTIMPIDQETIIMKKLDKVKLIKEFRSIRSSVKNKLTAQEINEEIKQVRKAQ
tara:strand:+ start:47 stop:298 length:252 start_codon:yes stop_codon:yes gene_type:complete